MVGVPARRPLLAHAHTRTGTQHTTSRTWSLRERPVCSLPPTAPTSSVRRRSLAVWMSSSPATILNAPARHSSATCVRPATISSASLAVRMPALASALAYAWLPCFFVFFCWLLFVLASLCG